MRDGVHNIFSREMKYMTFSYERWSPQYILKRDEVHDIYMRDGVHNIFSREMKYMTFSYERWSPQYILKRDEVHDI